MDFTYINSLFYCVKSSLVKEDACLKEPVLLFMGVSTDPMVEDKERLLRLYVNSQNFFLFLPFLLAFWVFTQLDYRSV